jgi:hypothetical protein
MTAQARAMVPAQAVSALFVTFVILALNDVTRERIGKSGGTAELERAHGGLVEICVTGVQEPALPEEVPGELMCRERDKLGADSRHLFVRILNEKVVHALGKMDSCARLTP